MVGEWIGRTLTLTLLRGATLVKVDVTPVELTTRED
jgi:hypothetical protein